MTLQAIFVAQLGNLHTFSLAATCQQIHVIEQTSQLQQIDFTQPFCLLGEGSNSIFLADYQGQVICMQTKGIEVTQSNAHFLLRVAAGENWHQLVEHCLHHAMYGLENLALIPGTVGAAPVQNIGAYGVELAQFIDYVEGYNIRSNATERLNAAQCEFGYRDSIFKHALKEQFVITHVGLALPKTWRANTRYAPLNQLESPTPQRIFDTVIATRQQKLPDPKTLANAGSFFKNPIVSTAHAQKLKLQHPNLPCYEVDNSHTKLAAGWLIDNAGLKGFSLGGIGIHQKQALVLVNTGTGTASELIAMIKHIQHTVWQQYQVALAHEVRLIDAHGECHIEVEK